MVAELLLLFLKSETFLAEILRGDENLLSLSLKLVGDDTTAFSIDLI